MAAETFANKAAILTDPTAAAQAAAAHPGWVESVEIWIALAFIIFFGIFARYLLPVITKSLDDRSAKIRDQLEQASRLRAEAQALLAQYQQQQEAMLKEAEQIIADARNEAAELRSKAAEELKQQLERRSLQAQEKIARAETDAIETLRRQMIDAATVAARELIAKQLQSGAEDQAIDRALAAIEQQIH